MGRTKLKIFDFIIIAIAIMAIILSSITIYSSSGTARLVVTAQGETFYYPLDLDTEISISGKLGNTIIKINKKTAFIVSSPCENKTCVNASPLSKIGDWTACLPNGVMLQIEGKSKGDVDGNVR